MRGLNSKNLAGYSRSFGGSPFEFERVFFARLRYEDPCLPFFDGNMFVMLDAIDELPLFLRECITNHYNVWNYFISKLVVESITIFIQALLSLSIMFYILNFQGNFWYLLMLMFTFSLSTANIGLSLATALPNPTQAKDLLPIIMCKYYCIVFRLGGATDCTSYVASRFIFVCRAKSANGSIRNGKHSHSFLSLLCYAMLSLISLSLSLTSHYHQTQTYSTTINIKWFLFTNYTNTKIFEMVELFDDAHLHIQIGSRG